MRAAILYYPALGEDLKEHTIVIFEDSTELLRAKFDYWSTDKPYVQYVSFDGVLFRAEMDKPNHYRLIDVLTGIEI